VTLRGAQFCAAGYDIPNIRGEGRTVCTNHAWGAAFRGYGGPEAEFPSEVLMDELAEKLGMDPLELRYKHVSRTGSPPPTGQEPDCFSCRMIDILCPSTRHALEKAKARLHRQQSRRGVGVAVGVTAPGLTTGRLQVDVELNPDGSVTAFYCWEDHGRRRQGGPGHGHEGCAP
jgi:aldehyde oxidoreductase